MPDKTRFHEWGVRMMNDLMRDFGLTKLQAAAVVGNAAVESGYFLQMQELNPTVAGSRGGLGMFQWTGPRRRDFEAWLARNKHKNWTAHTYDANYSMLYRELIGPEKATLPKLKATTRLDQAVEVFCNSFERPGILHMQPRKDRALEIVRHYDALPSTEIVPPEIDPHPPVLEPRMPTKEEIERLQLLLRELGYFIVGKVDGVWGENTTAAMAAFQHRMGLPITGALDTQTQVRLASAAANPQSSMKVISPERARTTETDLVNQGSITVQKAKSVNLAAIVASVVAAIPLVLEFINYVAQNWQQTELPFPLNMAVSFLPPWALPLVLIAFCAYTFLQQRGIITNRVMSERTGLHNGEPDPAPSPPVKHQPDHGIPVGYDPAKG